jgi:hypothetical protein
MATLNFRMDYPTRRDRYISHVNRCKVCVSSFSGKTKCFLDNSGNRLRERYATVSQLCPEARKLAEEII